MAETLREAAGMALASALMAANYPGDSGEDVDRLIAELEKRGYRLVSDAVTPLRRAAQAVIAATDGSHFTMTSHDHDKCLPWALDMLKAALAVDARSTPEEPRDG